MKNKILKPEVLEVVGKFQEYNATVMIGFGSKANWNELVHQPHLYSDDALKTRIAEFQAKLTAQQLVADAEDDEDEVTEVTEFYVKTGMEETVKFTTEDVLVFLRAARRMRKYMAKLVINKAEITKLQKSIERQERDNMSPADLLANDKKRLSKLLGEPEEEAVEL